MTQLASGEPAQEAEIAGYSIIRADSADAARSEAGAAPGRLHPEAAGKGRDTAILEGTRVLVSDTAAGLLNKTFKTEAVKADMLVGIAKITVNTK